MPLIHRMGPSVELELRRHGFYPAGGGRFHARITPAKKLSRLDLPDRGSIRSRQARILVSKLPEHVGQRELAVVRDELRWREEECVIESVTYPVGPGNAVVLAIETEHVAEVFTGFGERGRPAEEVAKSAVEAAKAWLEADVPVDEHLADQLLIPMVLAGGGSFRTTRPSLHSSTNAEVIQRFLPVPIHLEQESDLAWRVTVGQA
jgi:RNA 3'-terminal phosphate cyclase (ATP)